MMRFSQVKELLLFLKDSQHAIAKLYKRIACQCGSERVRMYLHYLEQREGEYKAYLDRITCEAPESVLLTWLDQERFDIIAWCHEQDVTSYQSVEDILELTQELEMHQQAMLKQAIGELVSGSAETLLSNLLEHQQHRQQQLVHSMHRMDDM